ncbi:hypothetical protein BKA64DRAFT_654980 [Cadophora sp. MPI-SDFR-AT-0126]|nr:hypothetical protein BKA64DRAFT_654980 [Leotiomycetes sp. MPI-SDFR-AT-0126]
MLSLSPAELLPTAEYPELAETETSITVNHTYSSAKRTRERSKLDPETMAKICRWPIYSSPLCSEIKAKVNVSCINCDFEDRRDWQGRIMGSGFYGALRALLIRIKHKCRLFRDDTPLMELWTVCIHCFAKLELFHEVDQIGMIFDFKDSNKRAAGMVLRISYKEIEDIVSCKVIMMEGVLLSAITIKTVGVDGKWRK